MNWTQIEDFYGSQAAAAEAIGASLQRIHNYAKRGRVPLETQVLFEAVSDGALKADLPEYFRKQAA
jgi:hypothetical protein